jgi:5-methylcytosine-specific restriction endonuclease McrA
VFERDDFRCLKCGSRRNLNADHIHPESKGGPTTLENLQTLCRGCNSRKGARVVMPQTSEVT